MRNHYVECLLGMLVFGTSLCVDVEAQSQANDVSNGDAVVVIDTLTPKRIKSNHLELQKMLLVDSLSWVKANATRSADTKDAEVANVYNKRHVARLKGFCNDKRFASLSEVDLLTEMTSEERGFCKDRLKLLNPLMP